ncbi:MAG: hypothetical protein AB1556_17700 [Bacillota bacterium]
MKGTESVLVLLALGLFTAGVVYQLRQKPAFRIALAGVVAGTAAVILAAVDRGAFGIIDMLEHLAILTGLVYLVGGLVARRRRLATRALFYPGVILFLAGVVMSAAFADQIALN